MSFSIPYLFTLYLRLENQTSALVFLKFSGNARTTNLRPLVCLFFCLFFFSDVSSQVTGILCSELSKKKCSWEMSPRNSLGLSRSVKTECKERKSATTTTTTTTAKVLISDTRFLKIWILPFRAICLLFELFGFELSWARIKWTLWMNYHA